MELQEIMDRLDRDGGPASRRAAGLIRAGIAAGVLDFVAADPVHGPAVHRATDIAVYFSDLADGVATLPETLAILEPTWLWLEDVVGVWL